MILYILVIVFALFALSRAFLRLREKQISVKEFIFWLIIWIGVIITSIIPESVSQISILLGIDRGVDFLTYISIILLFYLIFRLYVKCENIEQDITKIVRELSHKKK